jgi:hypothetical protein
MARAKKTPKQEPASDMPAEFAAAFEPPSETTAPQAADKPPASQGAPREQRAAGEERRHDFQPRPVITEVIKDAKTGEVTTARYIDGYNAGVGVSFQFPTEEERPSDAVKEALKGQRKYGNREQPGMRWRRDLEPKQWHKPAGDNPVATRLEAEGRFTDAVKKLRQEKEGKEPDDTIPL